MSALKQVFQLRWFAALSMVVLLGMPLATTADTETGQDNNACVNAQDLNTGALPLTVFGSLDPESDIDFFRLELPADIVPGTPLRIELSPGLDSDSVPVFDAYLGLFNRNCVLLAVNDYGDGTSAARLVFAAPADGVLILAATGCCDISWMGNHQGAGAYQLSVVLATQIQARMVDAETGNGISGLDGTWAYSDLWECGTNEADPDSCDVWVDSAYADADGNLVLNAPGEGVYLARGYASGYETYESSPISLSGGAVFQAGDIPLAPLPEIGSVSGRVVDAKTGVGLSGAPSYPYAYLVLERCDGVDYCYWAGYSDAGEDGSFQFSGAYPGQYLPGDYRLTAYAQDRIPKTTPIGFVGEGVSVGSIEVALDLLPIRISDVRACADLTSEGGLCRYSARIKNNSDRLIQGAAWSTVYAYGLGSLAGGSHFQTGSPVSMTLVPNSDSRQVAFVFYVPPSVADGVSICADVQFGQSETPQFFRFGRAKPRYWGALSAPFFNTLASESLFCLQKGATGFALMPQGDAQRLMQGQGSMPAQTRRALRAGGD